MSEEVKTFYQITDKYTSGAIPVSYENFISKFDIDEGEIYIESFPVTCFSKEGESEDNEFIYFKKVKKFKKNINYTYKLGDIEFGI